MTAGGVVAGERDGGGSGGGASLLWLPDAAARADLATFAARARRVDADGAVRLVAHGNVLTVTACALHGASGPTVLAMRALVLAAASDVDATVPAAALVDHLARDEAAGPGVAAPGAAGPGAAAPGAAGPGVVAPPAAHEGATSAGAPAAGGGQYGVPLPPGAAVRAAWAGLLPPRRGWERTGAVPVAVLAAAAREGIAAVAAGTPSGAGAAAVTRLRAGVWGRPLAGYATVPTGVAFAADAFGFLGGAEEAAADAGLHRAGPWIRLSTPRGHVLARPASLFG